MAEPASARDLSGRYAIGEEIGHGGMGRVFVARDLRLDREVAIKFLTGSRDEADLRRFEQEARAAGSLQHPNVLVVHDVGASDDGPYIVSELLRGATLRERMQGKALPVAKAVDYALQLVQGLRAAHDKGVIHRDLKPDNLFITHDGRLKILDFGVAKLTERAEKPVATTAEGACVGTVSYMSPEQVRARRADARSDIFAFGSILYEMLSGRRAFAGATDIETGAAILNDDPRPLPAHVPRPLERIVWRCLEKEPSDRFQSAADLAVELSGERGRAPRRAWLAFVAGAALFAAILAPEVWKRVRSTPVPAERNSIAVLPFVNMSDDKDSEYFSDGVTEDLINALANVGGLRVASRTSAFSFKGKKVAANDIGQQLKVATLVEGSVRREGNNLRVVAQLIDVATGFHLWSNTYDRQVRNVLAVEEEVARSIAQALRPSLVRGTPTLVRHQTTNADAHDLFLRARFFWNDRTEAGLRKAIALYQKAVTVDPGYALAHAGLADSYVLLRNYATSGADPDTLLRQARFHAERAIQEDETLAEAHTSLATIAEADFDWKTAEREHRRAIDLKPDYSRAHHWYGLLLRDLGRFDESDTQFALALQLDPTAMPILIISAQNRYSRRDYDGAIAALSRLSDIAPGEPAVPMLVAATYLKQGRSADAVAVLEKIASPMSDDDGFVSLLAYGRARAGDRAGALRGLAELEARSRRQFVAPSNMALIQLGLGDTDAAFAWLDKAWAVRDPSLASLKVEPLWDGLRGDPRFRKLLTLTNLE